MYIQLVYSLSTADSLFSAFSILHTSMVHSLLQCHRVTMISKFTIYCRPTRRHLDSARLCVQDAGMKLDEEFAILQDSLLFISFGEIFFNIESHLNKEKSANHPSSTARGMFPLVRCQWGNTCFFPFTLKNRVLMGHRFVCY